MSGTRKEIAEWAIKVSTRLRYSGRFHSDMTVREISNFHIDETDRYRYFQWYFYKHLPVSVQRHRRYFSQGGRGFGENAMHAMWWKILDEFEPKFMLEIGVYRGQTISLWSLIAQLKDTEPEIWGISPLRNIGDSVSEYQGIDYRSDIIANYEQFGLEKPNLFEALSTDERTSEFVSSKSWDLIYIDGSHDEDIVLQDFELCSPNLKNGGLLVIDDASLYSGYKPPRNSFAGHPGPSGLAIEIAKRTDFDEIGSCGHNRIFMKLK
jgi:hypothetical protein